MGQESNEDRYLANSLIRGLEILRLFDAENPTLSLAEIARKLGVKRSIPFRLVYTLQKLGYLRQDESTKRYELTPEIIKLGFAYLQGLQLPEIARPYLEKLRDLTNSSTHLGILDGAEVVYVARVPARGMSSLNVTIGSRLPAHATSMGKLLMAFLPEEKQDDLIFGRELQAYTVHTKTEIIALKQELKSIKEKGYALSNEEFESGIRSLAVPIYGENQKVIAAISLAGSKAALKDDLIMTTFLPELLDVSKQLSVFSGFSTMSNKWSG